MKSHIQIQKIKDCIRHILETMPVQKEIYRVIIELLNVNKKFIDKKQWDYWQFDEFASYDPECYFCEYDTQQILHALNDLLRSDRAQKIDNYLMALRDVLWNIINVDSGVFCDVCKGGTYKFLWDQVIEQPVYHCDVCGTCYSLDMKPYNPETLLKPMLVKHLKILEGKYWLK